MYLDLIKGYRVTIWGYNAPLKEHRENMCMGATKSSSVNNYRMVSTCTRWPCFQVSGALLSMQRCDKVMDVVSETQCHSLKMCTILWHHAGNFLWTSVSNRSYTKKFLLSSTFIFASNLILAQLCQWSKLPTLPPQVMFSTPSNFLLTSWQSRFTPCIK